MTRKFRVAPLDRMGKLLSNPLTGFLFLFAGLLWWVLPFPFAPRGYLVSPEGITIRALVTSYVIPKRQKWPAVLVLLPYLAVVLCFGTGVILESLKYYPGR